MTSSALTMAPPPPAATTTALQFREELVFPVGFDLGPFYPAPGEPLAHYEVCVGRTSLTLPTEDDYRIWTLAHQPGEHSPLTWPTYRDRLADTGIADAFPLAQRLADNGMLWSVSPTGAAAAEFVRGHRLLPLATAIGDVEVEVPADTYALGLPRGPYHYASAVEYWLWLWGAQWDSLWTACEALAKGTDPLACVAPVLLATQELIVGSVAFLDVAWDRR